MEYKKTYSKHFFDHEIKGITYVDGKKVIYLKTGVKRQWRYNDHLIEEHMDHLNKALLMLKGIEDYYKKVVGIDDFEKDS